MFWLCITAVHLFRAHSAPSGASGRLALGVWVAPGDEFRATCGAGGGAWLEGAWHRGVACQLCPCLLFLGLALVPAAVSGFSLAVPLCHATLPWSQLRLWTKTVTNHELKQTSLCLRRKEESSCVLLVPSCPHFPVSSQYSHSKADSNSFCYLIYIAHTQLSWLSQNAASR